MDKYRVKLDNNELKRLNNDIRKEISNILDNCEDFCEALAKVGVQLVKLNILSLNDVPFDTGQLYNSIKFKRGSVVQNGATYYVYTDLPYAKFIEFGTGIVGSNSPHPKINEANWKYGNEGWWYYNERTQKVYYTEGMKSRPFMSNTVNDLNKLVAGIAKEVFK